MRGGRSVALLAAAMAGAAAWITAVGLIEAYDSGPPYYGRTTNMDKWESPVPFLVALDICALVIVAILGRIAWTRWRQVDASERGTSGPLILKGQQRFPDLAAFMGGWFHQDFDLHGDTLDDVVAAFVAESGKAHVQPLIDDIDAFLATGDEELEERFQEYFMPDIISTAFRPSTREFLVAIRQALQSDAQ